VLAYLESSAGERPLAAVLDAELDLAGSLAELPGLPAEFAGLKYRGKTDRVDELAKSPFAIRVVDYKTGNDPSGKAGDLTKSLAAGTAFQLPIYLLLAVSHYRERGRPSDPARGEMEWHVLGTGKKGPECRRAPKEPFPWPKITAPLAPRLAESLQGIKDGFYPPLGVLEKNGEKCQYCSWRALCRRSHSGTRYRLAADERAKRLRGAAAAEEEAEDG